MEEPSAGGFRLPVWNILRDTFLIPWRHPREFLRPLALPGLVIAVFTIGWDLTKGRMPAPVGWLIYAAYGAVFTVFAVSCHRLVLLGPSAETLAPKVRWGLRESKFLGWLVLMAALVLTARLAVIVVLANVGLLIPFRDSSAGAGDLPGVSRGWLDASSYFGFGVGIYLVARWSPVLPATAIGAKASLRAAWRLSVRNGWRLAVIVGALPWALSYGVSLLYRQNATLPELTILVVLSVLFSMLEIIALSLSYQDLTSGREPPV